MTLTATAYCLILCGWIETGDWAATDRAAQAHTRHGHPTAVVTEVTR